MKNSIILVSTLTLAGLAAAAPTARATAPHYIVAFGDSYSATGFNVSGPWPSTEQPFGNPSPGSATFSGGLNWLNYLATKYNTSPTLVFDMAYGGATTDADIISARLPSITTATQQVYDEFIPKVGKGPWLGQPTTFSLLIGINDINRCITLKCDFTATLPKLIAQREKMVASLYHQGARSFLFQNIPPLDRTPQVVEAGADNIAQNKQYVDMFNKALVASNKKIRTNCPDATIKEYDLWSFFTGILNSPDRYGFTTGAQGSGKGGLPNIWYGQYHPGYAFDQLWAQDLASKFTF